jgi:acyl-CoA synthetase (AMP-forming)/AMP-acid ligase II
VRLTAGELVAILRDAEPRWLIAGERFAPLWPELASGAASLRGVLWIGEPPPGNGGELWEEIAGGSSDFVPATTDPDRIAHLYYTSGTTGRPKGVMLTHGNVCAHARAAIAELTLGEGDVWGHFAPMFHLADAWATFAITAVGGRHAFVPRFAADAAVAAITRHGVTITNLVPTMLGELVQLAETGRHDLSSLRLMLSGGAPISGALVERTLAALGCDYAQTYGMTETSPYLTISLLREPLRALPPAEQLRFKCKTGRPFRGVELRVVDDTGVAVPADGRTVGEIRARGPTVTKGYWRQPEATREAFLDGWLRTGDLAVVDTEGYLDIVDRRKDMIVTGGENVYSIEVENVLYRHPAVREAAVFGVPDAKWGEAVRAAVALRAGALASESELIAHCRAHLAGFKTPRRIVFLDALPRTGTGKIAKRLLRETARS